MSSARANPELEESGDVKIFRPKLSGRFWIFLFITLLLPVGIFAAWVDLLMLLEDHSLKGFGNFVEGLAIVLIATWFPIYLLRRQFVVLFSISHSMIRFKSLFRDVTVAIPEGVTLKFWTTSRPLFFTFLKIWTPAGRFTLTNIEFNPAQLNEINHLLIRSQVKRRPN